MEGYPHTVTCRIDGQKVVSLYVDFGHGTPPDHLLASKHDIVGYGDLDTEIIYVRTDDRTGWSVE